MSFTITASGHVPQPVTPSSSATADELKEFDTAQQEAVAKEQALFDDLRAVFDSHKDVVSVASFYGSHLQGSLLSPVEQTDEERVAAAEDHEGLAN